MRRRHSPAELALLARWRRVKRWVMGDHADDRPISRKRHPLDCGQPNCHYCRAVRGGDTSPRDRAALESYRHQLHDLDRAG